MALRVALACIVIGLVLVGVYVHTDSGRRALADGLERLVSDQIPGTLEIGELEEMGWLEPVLRDVRFIHPDGTTVLRLERVRLDVDVAYLLRGRLGFHHAETSGGEIVLSADPDGRLGLEATFDKKTPSSQASRGDAQAGFHYRLRSIHVQRLTVVARVGKDEILRIRQTRGFVGVTRVDTPGVQVRLERLSGVLDRTLFGSPITLERADGDITGKAKRILDLELALRIDRQPLHAKLRLFDRDKTPAELTIRTEEGLESNLTALGLKLGSWFTDAVNVEWN